MVEKEIIVTNDTGLHSRPADLFVRTAKLYKSNITISKEGKSIDAKNIVKMLLLNVQMNNTITIQAEGDDEVDAVDALTRLIESDFKDVDSRVTI